MSYTNSPLVNYTRLSPNHSGLRNHTIDRITPHCVVGQCTVEALGSVFAPATRQGSSNYGIGYDGRVGMYVEEKNRSWCSSSGDNDHRAVTIEVASDTTHPYAIRTAAYNKLIDLCVDICKRNGKTKLIWFGDKVKTLNYEPAPNEMIITVHRWFAATACPGDSLYSKLGDLAAKVTAKLGAVKYYVEAGEYSNLKEARDAADWLVAAGFAATVKDKNHNVVKDTEIKLGDLVKMQKNAPIYGTTDKFKDFVYNSNLYVRAIDVTNSRVVVSTLKTGAVTGAVDKKYLTKI